jgi:SP family sugar:H+ symporter-like MFS transporter
MFFAEKFGRRPSFFIAGAIFFLGSLLQIVSATGRQSHAAALNQLYVGRAIGGFGVGMVSVLTPTVSLLSQRSLELLTSASP